VVALTVCGETGPAYAVEEVVKGCEKKVIPKVEKLSLRFGKDGKKGVRLEW
jgi:hypothetical protein